MKGFAELTAAFTALRDELIRLIDIRTRQHVAFEVVTTSPFTVYLAGDTTTAVDALKVSGGSYSIGDRGTAICIDGTLPICLKTTT